MSICGASLLRMTRKLLKLDCCTRPLSKVISPHSTPDRPKMMLDWICASTVSGLTIAPRSATTVTLCTTGAPSFIEISAICAM